MHTSPVILYLGILLFSFSFCLETSLSSVQDAKAIHDIWSCLPICTKFSQDFSSDKCFLLYFHGLEDNKW